MAASCDAKKDVHMVYEATVCFADPPFTQFLGSLEVSSGPVPTGVRGGRLNLGVWVSKIIHITDPTQPHGCT